MMFGRWVKALCALVPACIALIWLGSQGEAPEPAAIPAKAGSAAGWGGPTAAAIADGHGLSPFAPSACLSSSCSSEFDEAARDQDEELPARTVMFGLLDRVGTGDLQTVVQLTMAMERCIGNHRVRVLVQRAWPGSARESVTECSPAELREIVELTERTVARELDVARSGDANLAMARASWLMSAAHLDDLALSADAPIAVQPDAQGTLVLEDLPAAPRKSPLWKKLEKFALARAPTDPEMARIAASFRADGDPAMGGAEGPASAVR